MNRAINKCFIFPGSHGEEDELVMMGGPVNHPSRCLRSLPRPRVAAVTRRSRPLRLPAACLAKLRTKRTLSAGMASGASASASCRLPMDYEAKIFPHIGGYGRYNRVAVVFSWFPTFAVALNLFSDVYFTLIPNSYHCKPDPELLPSSFLLSNYSKQGYQNLTIPWVNGLGLSHCQLYKYATNISDLSGKVPRETVPCTRGWEYSTVVGLQSNFVTEVGGCFQCKCKLGSSGFATKQSR